MLMPTIFRRNFVDDLFDDMFTMTPSKMSSSQNSLMNTNVKEFDDKFELDVELPGYDKKDISAELNDGYLTIKASRVDKKDEKDEKGKFIRRERFEGTCQRQFYVGDQLTEEDIKAGFDNGVLKLSIPKKDPKKELEQKKYIAIE